METNRPDGNYIPIDYAKAAEGYGVKTFRATNIEELREAFMNSKKEKGSTLIDIKVVPGTMTGGYDSWWRVGVPEVSGNENVKEAYIEMQDEILKTKKF